MPTADLTPCTVIAEPWSGNARPWRGVVQTIDPATGVRRRWRTGGCASREAALRCGDALARKHGCDPDAWG